MKKGSLRNIKPNQKVIENALNKAHRDLRVSTTLIEKEEYDWAYTTSYTAIHTTARAYMNKMGYTPPSRDGHRAVVDFLEAPELGQDLNMYARLLDRMRRTRHRVMYDEYDLITEKGAKQANNWAKESITLIEEKLKE
ncbi:MAG: HEPN domain-containing protein [Candidatus Bathyarchaeota archaeon]|nr:HEPN domain-containing protein [Candidatus Bathyarchaeota archaeon]